MTVYYLIGYFDPDVVCYIWLTYWDPIHHEASIPYRSIEKTLKYPKKTEKYYKTVRNDWNLLQNTLILSFWLFLQQACVANRKFSLSRTWNAQTAYRDAVKFLLRDPHHRLDSTPPSWKPQRKTNPPKTTSNHRSVNTSTDGYSWDRYGNYGAYLEQYYSKIRRPNFSSLHNTDRPAPETWHISAPRDYDSG